MFKSILVSVVLGLVATTAVVGCSGNTSSEESESGGSAVISGKQFTTSCALSVTVGGKTLKGTAAGQFKVNADNTLTASQPFIVTNEAGTNQDKLTVKSGVLTDAKNEIFEFTANQPVFGFDFDTMDVTIQYDGTKKIAHVTSKALGELDYTATCRFKDAAGNDTTNF